MKESILNDEIINIVNKWGAIYTEDLISHLAYFDYKAAHARVYIDRLVNKGIVEKTSDLKNVKKKIIILKEGINLLNDNDGPTPSSAYHTHDSVTTGLCLDISKFDSVADINGSRHTHDVLSKRGDIIPDAEFALWKDKKTGIIHGALEVEIQQKNKVKILSKFNSYSANDSYSFILYFFPNKRMALTYYIMLAKAKHDSINNNLRNFDKFIFLYRKDETLSLTKLSSYEPYSPDNVKVLKTIFN